jgi:cysteine-rich repeat protein
MSRWNIPGLQEISEEKMRVYILLCLSLILFSGTAQSADLTCTIPAANVTRGVELCEELRLKLRVRSSEWDNDVCATQFLRIGMVAGERVSATKTANTTVSGDVNDAVVLFQSTWARPTPVACGDGTLDTEFGEECDDGNSTNGDGCSDACVSE